LLHVQLSFEMEFERTLGVDACSCSLSAENLNPNMVTPHVIHQLKQLPAKATHVSTVESIKALLGGWCKQFPGRNHQALQRSLLVALKQTSKSESTLRKQTKGFHNRNTSGKNIWLYLL